MSKYPGNIISTGADTGYSVFFDGTGDQLTLADNAALDLSTGDFTVECWFYITSSAVNSPIIRRFDGDAGSRSDLQYAITYTSSGSSLVLAPYQGVTTLDITFSGVSINQWHHCALVRTGNTVYGFLDGVRNATSRGVTTMNTGAWLTYIGGYREGGVDQWCNGYISNVRIIKGTALYTGATYNVPTQLQNISGTSLLTCNSPAIVDQSSNAFAITANGNAAVSTFTPFVGYQAYNPALGAATPGIWTVSDALQAAANRSWNMYDPYFNLTTLKLSGTPVTNVPTWITDASTNNFAVTPVADARAANFSPFSSTTYPNSGSGYFDGTGDYLTVPANAAFSSGTGAFTWEAWVYSNVSGPVVVDNASGAITAMYISNGGGNRAILGAGLYPTSGITVLITSSISVQASQWTHVALVRNAGVITLYINGVSAGTASNTTDSYQLNVIGAIILSGSALITFNGYISNVRMVKGTAVYTAAFTPPTAPLTAVTNTSLLTLQNSQSSNNNSFLDSSSNNFLITRFGNATQGTFTPFSQTGWSNFFGGNDSYFTATAAASLGTGNFTIEAFVYPTATTNTTFNTIFSNYTTFGTTVVLLYLNTTDSKIGFYANNTEIKTINAISLNRWYHIAVVRNSGVITMYLDGVQQATLSYSGSASGNGNAYVGTAGDNPTSTEFTGYISNLRVVIGSAVYTSGFTPPTAPLTSVANTSLLTCQSNRFVDTNTQAAAKTITVSGAPSIQAFSPFLTNNAYAPLTQGGSGYFDGSGDYLSCSSTNVFNFGTSAYTIEFWLYNDSSGAGYQPVINASGVFAIYTRTNQAQLWNGPNPVYVSSASLVPNAWNHVAIVRTSTATNGTVWYINGVASTAGTDANNWGANSFTVAFDATPRYLTGYFTGFRVVKSQALTTGAFTPPTVPVTASSVGWTGANVAASLTGSVAFLLGFNNAGIVDTTGKNIAETIADARISTAVSKFGGSSMFFDGTGDYLQFPSNPTFAMGGGNWTFETWLYPNNVANLQALLTFGGSAWRIFQNGTSAWFLNGSTGIAATGAVFSTGQWFHLALVKNGTAITIYINGVSSGTGSDSNTYAAGAFQVGAEGAGSYFNGYLQDMRVTRGVARYTSNFTPPTSLLQNQ